MPATPAEKPPIAGTSRERRAAALVLALQAALATAGLAALALPAIRAFHDGLPQPRLAVDHGARFARLRPHLPARGLIGYASDPAVVLGGAALDGEVLQLAAFHALLAQQALAPLLCRLNVPEPFVVGDYTAGTPPPAGSHWNGYEILAAQADGVFLLRLPPPPR